MIRIAEFLWSVNYGPDQNQAVRAQNRTISHSILNAEELVSKNLKFPFHLIVFFAIFYFLCFSSNSGTDALGSVAWLETSINAAIIYASVIINFAVWWYFRVFEHIFSKKNQRWCFSKISVCVKHAFLFENYLFRAYFFSKIGEVCDIHLHLFVSGFFEILMVSEN